jgi:hypothetical protein
MYFSFMESVPVHQKNKHIHMEFNNPHILGNINNMNNNNDPFLEDSLHKLK